MWHPVHILLHAFQVQINITTKYFVIQHIKLIIRNKTNNCKSHFQQFRFHSCVWYVRKQAPSRHKYTASGAVKARLHLVTPPREGPRARTPPTYSLAAEELHEAMAGDNVVRDDAFNVQVVDGGRHSPRSEDVPSAEVVDELQLEHLQNEEPSVRRQGAVRGR